MSTVGVPTVTLANGVTIPQLGFGTASISDAQTEEAVGEALARGYRLVDTAQAYGNEEGVGRALRASGVPREELFVTTKLNGQWHGFDEAQVAWVESTRRLGLDDIDLYLIHWPLPSRDRYVEAWRGLIKLLEDGRVRAIGVSNFKPAHIDRLIAETGVTPHVNQIQLDPTIARQGPRAYHAEHGIATESWSPLADGQPTLLDQPTIASIAEARGRTPAQVVLRWHVQLGLIAIPKSVTPSRIAENIDIFAFELTPAEMAEIAALDRGESAAIDSDRTGH